MSQYPKSKEEFELKFKNSEDCCCYLASIRWEAGFVCPYCEPKCENGKVFKRSFYKCKNCDKVISATAGTLFHDTRSLLTWFKAIWYITEHDHGVSILELQSVLDIGNYNIARDMLYRIRYAMTFNLEKLSGTVQIYNDHWGRNIKNRNGYKVADRNELLVAIQNSNNTNQKVRFKVMQDKTNWSFWYAVCCIIEEDTKVTLYHIKEKNSDSSFYRKYKFLDYCGNDFKDSKDRDNVTIFVKDWMSKTQIGKKKIINVQALLDEVSFRLNCCQSDLWEELFFHNKDSDYQVLCGELFFQIVKAAVNTPPLTKEQIEVMRKSNL
jgi:hypothetical protein